MAAETQTLNFGPEWLRTLSSGGSVTSPPPSPALPKYKLADHRYGREEMLALYIKEHKVPEDLMDKEFLPILNEEPLLPLALVPFTEEEQRNFSMSVNSAAVLRLMGRGGPVVAGAPRGRGVTRGRGRGRGEPGFYQRSFDEVEGGFGRGAREINRSQSWEERGGDRRFEKPGRRDAPVGAVVPPAPPPPTAVPSVRPVFDEASALLAKKQQHDFTRSDSENWRAMREEANGERWRQSSPDGPRSAGWREPGERPRRRFDFEFRERDEERGGGGGGGAYRRTRSGSGSFDDDNLPEWCLDDEGEMGTFDSSGAFMSFKKGPKEPIPEEQELEFKGADEEDEEADDEGEFRREDAEERQCSRDNKDGEKVLAQDDWDEASLESGKQEDRLSPTPCFSKELPTVTGNQPSLREEGSISHKDPEKMDVPDNQTLQHGSPQDLSSSKAVSSDVLNSVGISGPGSGKRDGVVGHDHDDDEGLKHLEQEAEKMVASLQDTSLEEDRLDTKNRASALPLTHEAAMKWFYKDPQGDIQGPFTNQEMAEWFQAGYFTMTLLVKRGCDEGFQPLGEVIKMWGRVPFAPGPVPPPFLNDPDHERLKRQQELAIIQMQLQYQQFLQAQLYSRDVSSMWNTGRAAHHPVLENSSRVGHHRITSESTRQCAQSIAQLQQKATLAPLTPQQQQHLALLIQHYQTLKQRTQEHQQGLIPAVSRSLSVPESTGSLWELKTPTSQPAGWEGGSIWDLPPESQGPTLEQLQQLEREKGGKLLDPERCEAELRMRDDDERKRQEEQVTRTCAVKVTTRRQQEELLQRQEEERKRREEEEAARRKQQEDEEQLRRQQEQEMLRRQEEKRRREEEERRQREDMIRKQEEERRHQEEEEARRRCEEDEEKKRKEVELQRQKELQQQQRQQELELQQRQQELELQQRQQDLELQQRQKELQQRQQQEMMRQRQQQEALRRLQQQQLAQMKLPSSSTWGQQVPAMSSQQSSLSLAEIQKIEEEREKQLREEQRRQQDLIKTLQQQQQQQQQKPVGWNNVSKAGLSAKSLLEIQQEEARHVQKQQQQQRAQAQAQAQARAQHSSVPINNASVWGNVSPGGSSNPWGSDVSNLWGGAGAGTIQEKKSPNIGFWDDAVKELGPPVRNVNMKTSKSSPSLGESYGIPSRQSKKKTEEEDKLMKLFQGVNKAQDGFTQWCEQMLHALNTSNNLDVPTFVSFLKEVESPYEVHDYITAYLGETPDAKEFAKQFLERRAKQKQNHQRQQQQLHQQQQQQESVWGLPQGGGGGSMPSAYQCGHSAAQQASFEAMQASKKKKKQRMVRADPSILGFSVNASSDRPNMGEIETLED
ncbi:GRB10-interacting GYF protein 2 isoform X2 [Petromyzon marinus]